MKNDFSLGIVMKVQLYSNDKGDVIPIVNIDHNVEKIVNMRVKIKGEKD